MIALQPSCSNLTNYVSLAMMAKKSAKKVCCMFRVFALLIKPVALIIFVVSIFIVMVRLELTRVL